MLRIVYCIVYCIAHRIVHCIVCCIVYCFAYSQTDILTLIQEAAKQSDSDDTNNDAADLSQADESCKSEDDSHSDLIIVDDVTASTCRTSVI